MTDWPNPSALPAPVLQADVEPVAKPGRTLVQGTDLKQLRGSNFTSVADLTDTIGDWADRWNDNPKSLVGQAPPKTSSPESGEVAPSPTPPNPRTTSG
jgi:hypothetical protein